MDVSGLDGSDRLLGAILRSRHFTPAMAATVVFLSGFATWAVWWVLLVARGDLAVIVDGVSRFPTGSLGDALLLPAAAALSVAAYRSLARFLNGVGESGDVAYELALERVERIVLGRLATVLPWLLAVAVVFGYHIKWVADPRFWSRFSPAATDTALIPAVYHGLFMVVGIWWLLAFLMRSIPIGSIVVPAVSKSGRSDHATVDALGAAWRSTAHLAWVLAGFAVLLYLDRYGLEAFWKSTEVHPEAVLCIVLAPIVLACLHWYWRAWIAPLCREAGH